MTTEQQKPEPKQPTPEEDQEPETSATETIPPGKNLSRKKNFATRFQYFRVGLNRSHTK